MLKPTHLPGKTIDYPQLQRSGPSTLFEKVFRFWPCSIIREQLDSKSKTKLKNYVDGECKKEDSILNVSAFHVCHELWISQFRRYLWSGEATINIAASLTLTKDSNLGCKKHDQSLHITTALCPAIICDHWSAILDLLRCSLFDV